MSSALNDAAIIALKALESAAPILAVESPLAADVMLAVLHITEELIEGGIDAPTLEALRAAVQARAQERLTAKFGG